MDKSTVQCALKIDLWAHPFKKRCRHLLSDATKAKRLAQFCELLCLVADPTCPLIVWSDEKYFTVEQAHNVQNDRVWSSDIDSVPDGEKMAFRRQRAVWVMVWVAVMSTGEKSPVFTIPSGVEVNGVVYLNFRRKRSFHGLRRHSLGHHSYSSSMMHLRTHARVCRSGGQPILLGFERKNNGCLPHQI